MIGSRPGLDPEMKARYEQLRLQFANPVGGNSGGAPYLAGSDTDIDPELLRFLQDLRSRRGSEFGDSGLNGYQFDTGRTTPRIDSY